MKRSPTGPTCRPSLPASPSPRQRCPPPSAPCSKGWRWSGCTVIKPRPSISCAAARTWRSSLRPPRARASSSTFRSSRPCSRNRAAAPCACSLTRPSSRISSRPSSRWARGCSRECTSRRISTTATRPPAAGRRSRRPCPMSSSPTPTCSTWGSFPTTENGGSSSRICDTWSWTSCMSTGESLEATWPRSCGAYGGSARAAGRARA